MSKDKKSRCAWKLSLSRDGEEKSKKAARQTDGGGHPLATRRDDKNIGIIPVKKKPPRLKLKHTEDPLRGSCYEVPVIIIPKVKKSCCRKIKDRILDLLIDIEFPREDEVFIREDEVFIVIPKNQRNKWLKFFRWEGYIIEKLVLYNKQGGKSGVTITDTFRLKFAS